MKPKNFAKSTLYKSCVRGTALDFGQILSQLATRRANFWLRKAPELATETTNPDPPGASPPAAVDQRGAETAQMRIVRAAGLQKGMPAGAFDFTFLLS